MDLLHKPLRNTEKLQNVSSLTCRKLESAKPPSSIAVLGQMLYMKKDAIWKDLSAFLWGNAADYNVNSFYSSTLNN